MPIIVAWDNDEKTIVRETFTGEWDWDDLDEANLNKITSMIESVDHRVDLLADLSESGDLPPGHPLRKGYEHMSGFPENWGMVAAVSQNLLYRMLLKALKRIFPTITARLFVVTTIEEAYEVIKAERQKDRATRS